MTAVEPAFAGVLDQSGIAMPAAGKTGQKCRAVGTARWRAFRVAALEKVLDGIEGLFVDDCGNFEGNPFRWRTRSKPAFEIRLPVHIQ